MRHAAREQTETQRSGRRVRALGPDPRTRAIPLIAVTGHAQQSVRERAVRDGVAAFFPKPCLPDELASVIRSVLDRYTTMPKIER